MSGKLSRSSYEQMIREDIEWLQRQPRTLEREHIHDVLKHAVEYEYGPAPSSPTLDATFDPDFNCPTHFAGGDPSCPACQSKQPKPPIPPAPSSPPVEAVAWGWVVVGANGEPANTHERPFFRRKEQAERMCDALNGWYPPNNAPYVVLPFYTTPPPSPAPAPSGVEGAREAVIEAARRYIVAHRDWTDEQVSLAYDDLAHAVDAMVALLAQESAAAGKEKSDGR